MEISIYLSFCYLVAAGIAFDEEVNKSGTSGVEMILLILFAPISIPFVIGCKVNEN